MDFGAKMQSPTKQLFLISLSIKLSFLCNQQLLLLLITATEERVQYFPVLYRGSCQEMEILKWYNLLLSYFSLCFLVNVAVL